MEVFNTVNHLDLFSGIGGFALAASWVWGEEHNITSFVEIDPFCQKVLKKHWPDVPIQSDIKEYKHDETEIFLLTGGFPCQDLSSNGRQKGLSGERSGLWRELFRIISDCRPKYCIIENVSNLLSGDDGRWFSRLLYDLTTIGFDVEWESISAASIGERHERDRVFILAHPSSERWSSLKFHNTVTQEHKGISGQYCSPGNQETRGISVADTTTEIDGIPNIVGEIRGYGNAIVPQTVVPIMQAIKEINDTHNAI